MNKTNDTKTTSRPAAKQSGDFFSKENSDSFFSPVNETQTQSFFYTQAKLNVGGPADAAECEADAIADVVVKRINTAPAVQASPVSLKPLPATQEKINKKDEEDVPAEESEPLQRKPIFESAADPEGDPVIRRKSNGENNAGTTDLESNLHDSKGGGEPLPADTRSSMEDAFNADFSEVKVHTGQDAVQMSNELGAQAFTNGNDIYFNQGKYNTNSTDGQHLLAHELTHTIQQGASSTVQQKPLQAGHAVPEIQAKSDSVPLSVPAPREFTLLSAQEFTPSAAVDEYITAAGSKGAEVNVSFAQMASGTIKVRKDKEGYHTQGKEAIPLRLRFLQPLVAANIQPALAIEIKKNIVGGYLTIGKGKNFIPSNKDAIPDFIQKSPHLMKWSGLDKLKMPEKIENKIEGGKLLLQVKNIGARFGGFVDSNFDLGLVNDAATINGHIELNIKNIHGSLDFQRDEAGNLKGKGVAAIGIKNFKGSVSVDFLNGIFDIHGKAIYTTEKLSGEVNIVVTDAAKAKSLALAQLEPEQINQQALEASGVKQPEAGPVAGPRAIAGWGTLNFAFNEWLTGTAKVIVDNEGHVTIHGEIAPPATVTLFDVKPYQSPDFINLHPTFRWGIPYIADLHVGLDFLLYAKAQIGPARLKDIKIMGTYSTDPLVFNDFRLQATLNMMGYASLVFEFGAHAGVGILGFDVDLKGTLTAEAGIRAYLEATPIVGYREIADPLAGKKGQFYLKGAAELAAQPFLALKGSIGVDVDSPWPIPNFGRSWPMFQKEYPLPGEFGIGLTFGEYVLGSGEFPPIEWGKVNFDRDKFTDDLVEKRIPPKQARSDEGKAGFKDELQGQQPAPPPAVAGATPVQPGVPAEKQEPPTREVLEKWTSGCKQLETLKDDAEAKPLPEKALRSKLNSIKRSFKFVKLEPTASGDNWVVYAEMVGINNMSSLVGIRGVPGEVKSPPPTATPGKDEAGEAQAPAHLEDLTVTLPNVKMDQGSHVLIAEVRNDGFIVRMRSREVILKDAALAARDEMLQKMSAERNPKRKEEYQEVIRVLTSIMTEIDDLKPTITLKLHETKAPGVTTAQLEKELLQLELAKIGDSLKIIGRVTMADSLDELTNEVVPHQRFLPIKGKPGEYIRGLLYEGMYQNEWDELRADFRTQFFNDITVRDRIEDAIRTRNQVEWAKLITADIIEYDANISSYNYRTVNYSLDHIKSVANLWNSTGKKDDDTERRKHFLNAKNLRWVPAKNNSQKGSGGETYDKWVEKGFKSSIAEGNREDARSIAGDPFVDAHGNPI